MKYRKSKSILCIILFAGLAIKVQAQEPVEQLVLSLEEAVDHAINYNKTLQNSRLEVEKAKRTIWESIAQGLPQAEGTLEYLTYFNYELAFEFGGGDATFTQDQIMKAMNTTLSQPQFAATTPQDLINHQAGNFMDTQLQSMLPSSTILMSDQSTAKLQLSQLIFSGQYIVGIQTAKMAKKISEQNLDFSELDIKEAVINAYYLVLITDETIKILEQNLENLNETLASTQRMFAAGMVEKTDVDQIRITVNQLENSRNSMERNLELNYNLLRFQLGLEKHVDLQLSDDLLGIYSSLVPENVLQNPFDIEANVTYQIMKTQEEINNKLVALEQWNYAPTIAGFYNYNGKILTTGFDMNPNHLAGFTMSIPIFSSGMRKARVDQAKIDYEMAKKNRSIMEDQLKLQDKQFRYNLQSALENLETQRENREVAMDIFESYRRKFEQGMASSLDLTQANNNYLTAESNFMTAIMDVLNARLQIDKLMNNL
jgi:outer membrane protein TolC